MTFFKQKFIFLNQWLCLKFSFFYHPTPRCRFTYTGKSCLPQKCDVMSQGRVHQLFSTKAFFSATTRVALSKSISRDIVFYIGRTWQLSYPPILPVKTADTGTAVAMISNNKNTVISFFLFFFSPSLRSRWQQDDSGHHGRNVDLRPPCRVSLRLTSLRLKRTHATKQIFKMMPGWFYSRFIQLEMMGVRVSHHSEEKDESNGSACFGRSPRSLNPEGSPG